MIHVFFVPGMFGSTIEYVLRSFTSEYSTVDAWVADDGSMHTYQKECHPASITEIQEFFDKGNPTAITTPFYPFKKSHLPEILKVYRPYQPKSRAVLIYADSLRSAELNMLFQYYKIAFGSIIKLGLDVFCGDNSHNIKNWNKSYQHWSEMQTWELREWVSLFYSEWVQEWINSQHQVGDNFLKISNTDILFDTQCSLIKIIDFCQLTLNKKLDKFTTDWQEKQDYIVREFNLLDQIISSTTDNIDFEWDKLNIISESIIQQRLRSLGYEIQCDGLDIFPTNAKTLYSLLERC